MEQNLFTEGVHPGSVTTPEEVHMLICYIFREAGQPVTLDQANEVLQRQSLVNYFEFAEAAERLIRMGHLRPAENGRYTLSPEGEKLADTFRQKLPAAVSFSLTRYSPASSTKAERDSSKEAISSKRKGIDRVCRCPGPKYLVFAKPTKALTSCSSAPSGLDT